MSTRTTVNIKAVITGTTEEDHALDEKTYLKLENWLRGFCDANGLDLEFDHD